MTSKQRNVPRQADNKKASAHDLIAILIWEHFDAASVSPKSFSTFLIRAKRLFTALKESKQPSEEETLLINLLQFLIDIHDLLQSKTTFDNQRFPVIAKAIDESVDLTVQALKKAAAHVKQNVAPDQQFNLEDPNEKKPYAPRYTVSLCGRGNAVNSYYEAPKGIHTLLCDAHEGVQEILRSDRVLDAIAEGATRFSFRQFLRAFFAIFTRGPSPSKIPFLERCQAADPHLAARYGSLYHSKTALDDALRERKEHLAKEKQHREKEAAAQTLQQLQAAAQKLQQLIDHKINKPSFDGIEKTPPKAGFEKFSPEKFAEFQAFLQDDPTVSLITDVFTRNLVNKVLALTSNDFTSAQFNHVEMCVLKALRDHQKTNQPTQPAPQPASRYYNTLGVRPGY